MRKIWCWFFLLFAAQHLVSQDYRYNFSNSSASQLNPALIGAYDGKIRVATQYRNLYSSLLQKEAFKGYGIAADYKISDQRGNFFGLGIATHQNNHPRSNFKKTEALLGVSYQKKIAENNRNNRHYITAGFQVGVGQHRINPTQLWFTNQWNQQNESIDLSEDSRESWLAEGNAIFPDLHAGLLWLGTFNDHFSSYLGGSIFHIAKPSVTIFEEGTYQLERRWVIHGGVNYYFNKNIGIIPNLIWITQSYGNSLTLGNYLSFKGNGYDEVGFRLGAFLHQSNHWSGKLRPESFAIAVVIERNPIQFGINYDFTISELSAINQGRGAVEFQIMFTFKDAQSRIKFPSIIF